MRKEDIKEVNQLFQRKEFGKIVGDNLLQHQGFIKPLVNHMRTAAATEIESPKLDSPRKGTIAKRESCGWKISVPNGGPSDYSSSSSEDQPNNRRDSKKPLSKKGKARK